MRLNQKLYAGLLVGTLDILAACIQFFIKTGNGPSPVFRYIASGVFGTSAFTGGSSMIAAGVIFHYLIALAFTLLFFAIYHQTHSLQKNSIVIGIFYGVFIWCIMNFIALPLSLVTMQALDYRTATISVVILIICVGIPLSLIAKKRIRQ